MKIIVKIDNVEVKVDVDYDHTTLTFKALVTHCVCEAVAAYKASKEETK